MENVDWSHVTHRVNVMKDGPAKNAISNVLECSQQGYRAVGMDSARLTTVLKTQLAPATNNTEVQSVDLNALEIKSLAMAWEYAMKMDNVTVMLQHWVHALHHLP